MPAPSSGFGKRNLFGREFHYGIDYAVPRNSPVYVNKPITVTSVRPERGYGNTVRGTDAQGNEYILGHLNGVPDGVKPGTVIQPGQPIAYTGNTGDSTGPHLHYEVRKNGTAFDPTKTIDPSTGKPFTDNMSFENNGSGLNDSRASPDKNRRPGPDFRPSTTPGVTAPATEQTQPSSKPNSNKRPPKVTNFRTSVNPVLKYDDDPRN